MDETIMRLRSAQDMLRLLLGNADSKDADAVLASFVIDRTN
jgi:hypothetical protein